MTQAQVQLLDTVTIRGRILAVCRSDPMRGKISGNISHQKTMDLHTMCRQSIWLERKVYRIASSISPDIVLKILCPLSQWVLSCEIELRLFQFFHFLLLIEKGMFYRFWHDLVLLSSCIRRWLFAYESFSPQFSGDNVWITPTVPHCRPSLSFYHSYHFNKQLSLPPSRKLLAISCRMGSIK